MARFKWMLLRRLIRWAVRGYKFDMVLAAFWVEFRQWYPEDNLPSALATVKDVLVEEENK